MIGVDTNLLVYAHREDSPWHARARTRLVELAEGPASWAIPWPCLHEFLAIVTHPRIFKTPTPVALALGAVDALLEAPRLVLLSETWNYWKELRSVVARGLLAGPVVHDARIAALCRLHGVTELWSADRDFSRFPDLPVRNPLVG
ncbi:MAG TPA: TA system VapC family ribonuclease toxin [Vicinamibacteria bacterium]|nr:TA system VapC family ribonuclease toxin [Vicinamibacteria bacterium]